VDPADHDIRFVEDNWESPTLGAWGVGWEVWLDGMEVTQFTYFQQCGGFDCDPVSVELTYGLERLAMFIQRKERVLDLVWDRMDGKDVTYQDLYLDFEIQHCTYNFEEASIKKLVDLFQIYEAEATHLITKNLLYPAPRVGDSQLSSTNRIS